MGQLQSSLLLRGAPAVPTPGMQPPQKTAKDPSKHPVPRYNRKSAMYFQQRSGRGRVLRDPAASRAHGGVARQQQLDDFNATIRSGAVYGGITARGKGNQEQISEAQDNKT